MKKAGLSTYSFDNDVINKVIKEGTENELIRAVTLEGSTVTDSAVHDKYSDVDVTFFVSDIREFTKQKNYMDRFGEILIMQCPDDWYEEPYDYSGKAKFTFLTQYKDGSRIDLTLVDITDMEDQKFFVEPRKVLVNKDGFDVLKDISSGEAFFIQKPTEKEYFDACNEFRWLSNYATKGLCREQLPYVKRMTEVYMMDMFMKMINWKIGIDNDFKVTTGSKSKYLKNYLSEGELKRYTAIFANGEYTDMWFRLFIYYDFFADLAKYVAEKLGFFFDEKETKEVRDFMQNRREELKKQENAGKQVLLLGDSLRMGYEPIVRRLLKGKAGVSGPNENGRWAGYTLNSLRFWMNGFPTPDVIHWNNGLWDLGDDYHIGRPFSLPEEYESALERMVTVLNKLYPDAKIIMATTMPTDNPDSSDIEAYNDIMKKVAARHNIPVDDLFPIVKSDLSLIGPDHIHLTTEGFEKVGKIVAEEIERYL